MIKLLPFLPLLLLFTACGQDPAPETAPEGPPTVYTTFHPTTYFVERLAGDFVEVVCPLPADQDPIFWQPSREVLAKYQTAHLIVLNGAKFEKWPARASLPTSRIVDSASELHDEFITYVTGPAHRHGMGGMHTHEGIDGHTWVDPLTAKEQVATIAKALATHWPDHARAIEENRKALDKDLEALDARLRELTPKLADVQILCSHSAYNYLARRQGWTVKNFDFDPGTPLTDEQLEKLGVELTDATPAILFWESEPLADTTALLRDRFAIESILFSPAESVADADSNYLTVMGANVDRLEAAAANPKE